MTRHWVEPCSPGPVLPCPVLRWVAPLSRPQWRVQAVACGAGRQMAGRAKFAHSAVCDGRGQVIWGAARPTAQREHITAVNDPRDADRLEDYSHSGSRKSSAACHRCHRSISPMTISSDPTIAGMSAIRQPPQSSSVTERLQKDELFARALNGMLLSTPTR